MSALLTAVEGGHGLVGGAGLHLEEVGLRMVAFGTVCLRRFTIVPGRITTKDVVDDLLGEIGHWAFDSRGYRMDVGAGAALKTETGCVFSLGRWRAGKQGIGTLYRNERVRKR